MTTRTALLMNFVAPYRVPLFRDLRVRLEALRIFISTPMEPDRPWTPEWGGLDVVLQKTRTVEGVHHHPYGFDQRLFLHFPYDTLPQLYRYAPDVVISAELGLRTLQAALYRLLRRRSRLLVWGTLSEHTEVGWGLARRLLRRFLLRCADGVIVNGPSGARYIARFGIAPGRIFVVNQPIDVGLFAAEPVDRPAEIAYRLVFSGRLTAHKGVDRLQAALVAFARKHPERRVDMLWIGDGPLRGLLTSGAAPANLTQTFVGNVGYAALPALYAQAGVLVLPSRMDEWGLVVNEALASGLPVLGSRYSQAVEVLVRDGETGWQVDPLDHRDLLAGLERVFATPAEELAAMRVKARQRALAITPEAAAERIADAVRAVAMPPRRAGLAVTDLS